MISQSDKEEGFGRGKVKNGRAKRPFFVLVVLTLFLIRGD
jgi:hypothetical protein